MPTKVHGSGQRKGAAFERAMCVRLSAWVSKHTRDDVYWRTAMSGGRATLRSRKSRRSKLVAQSGDIAATHASGQYFLWLFVVECKFYQSLQLERLIYGKAGFLEKLWTKPLAEAHEIDREPFVIARQNRRDELVLTTERGVKWLHNGTYCAIPVLAFFPETGMYVLRLRDVLRWVDPDKLKAYAQERGEPETFDTRSAPESASARKRKSRRRRRQLQRILARTTDKKQSKPNLAAL